MHASTPQVSQPDEVLSGYGPSGHPNTGRDDQTIPAHTRAGELDSTQPNQQAAPKIAPPPAALYHAVIAQMLVAAAAAAQAFVVHHAAAHAVVPPARVDALCMHLMIAAQGAAQVAGQLVGTVTHAAAYDTN